MTFEGVESSGLKVSCKSQTVKIKPISNLWISDYFLMNFYNAAI